MKSNLTEQISLFLLKKGFTIKNLKSYFDILARKNSQIFLIKVLEDANSLYPIFADGLKKLASYLNASPIIISEKAGRILQNNIVYSRFGIYTINFQTFKNCIDKKLPFVKSEKSGLAVEVIGDVLKQKRENEGYSLTSLSKKLGVSSRMIVKYENENSEMSLQKATKLYDLFGSSVFKQVNIFELAIEDFSNFSSTDVSKKYLNLGFKALETKKTPFDIVAKKEKEIIFTKLGDKFNKDLIAVSNLIDADDLVIFKNKKPKEIPALTKEEFLEFEKAKELIKFLKEFE